MQKEKVLVSVLVLVGRKGQGDGTGGSRTPAQKMEDRLHTELGKG